MSDRREALIAIAAAVAAGLLGASVSERITILGGLVASVIGAGVTIWTAGKAPIGEVETESEGETLRATVGGLPGLPIQSAHEPEARSPAPVSAHSERTAPDLTNYLDPRETAEAPQCPRCGRFSVLPLAFSCTPCGHSWDLNLDASWPTTIGNPSFAANQINPSTTQEHPNHGL